MRLFLWFSNTVRGHTVTKIHYFVLKTLFFQTYKNVNKQLNLFQSVFSPKLTFWSFTTMCRSSYFSVMNDGMDCITKEGLKGNDVTSKYRGNCPMAKHISFEIGGRFLMYFYASNFFYVHFNWSFHCNSLKITYHNF